MAVHTWGVDKSLYDSPYGTAQIVAEGFGFMTHKAGGDKADPEVSAWWGDAKPHRDQILLGAYWVLYPNHGASAGDAFAARLDDTCPGWRDGPFILQLDCEKWNNDSSTMPGLGDIRACANRLRQLAPKLVPIVYAPRWAYGDSLTGLGFPLWSSSYVSASGPASQIYPGDSYSGWAAYSGIVPSIAQFSSSGVVAGDSNSDVNCFKGTVAQMVAQFAPGFVGDLMNWDDLVNDPDQPDRTFRMLLMDLAKLRGVLVGDTQDAARVPASAPVKVMLTNTGKIPGVAADVTTVKTQAQQIQATLAAGVPANVDVPALAAALDALLPNVTIDEATVIQAFRDMAKGAAPQRMGGNEIPGWDTPNPGVAGVDTPIHDEAADELTRRAREQRQREIGEAHDRFQGQ